MFNLYRASQLAFPREEILKNAKDFSYKYLQDKRERDELIDKWIIMKDLPGEVRYVTCNIRPKHTHYIKNGSKEHYINTYALHAILGSSDRVGIRQSVFGFFLLIWFSYLDIYFFFCLIDWVCVRDSMVRKLASGRDEILYRSIWWRKRRLDWQDPL